MRFMLAACNCVQFGVVDWLIFVCRDWSVESNYFELGLTTLNRIPL